MERKKKNLKEMLENNGGCDVQLQEPCPDKSCAVQFSGFSTSLVNPNFRLPFKLPPPPTHHHCWNVYIPRILSA